VPLNTVTVKTHVDGQLSAVMSAGPDVSKATCSRRSIHVLTRSSSRSPRHNGSRPGAVEKPPRPTSALSHAIRTGFHRPNSNSTRRPRWSPVRKAHQATRPRSTAPSCNSPIPDYRSDQRTARPAQVDVGKHVHAVIPTHGGHHALQRSRGLHPSEDTSSVMKKLHDGQN